MRGLQQPQINQFPVLEVWDRLGWTRSTPYCASLVIQVTSRAIRNKYPLRKFVPLKIPAALCNRNQRLVVTKGASTACAVLIVAHMLGREGVGRWVIDGSHATPVLPLPLPFPPFQSCALCLLPMSLVLLLRSPSTSCPGYPPGSAHWVCSIPIHVSMSRTKHQTLPRLCV